MPVLRARTFDAEIVVRSKADVDGSARVRDARGAEWNGEKSRGRLGRVTSRAPRRKHPRTPHRLTRERERDFSKLGAFDRFVCCRCVVVTVAAVVVVVVVIVVRRVASRRGTHRHVGDYPVDILELAIVISAILRRTAVKIERCNGEQRGASENHERVLAN